MLLTSAKNAAPDRLGSHHFDQGTSSILVSDVTLKALDALVSARVHDFPE